MRLKGFERNIRKLEQLKKQPDKLLQFFDWKLDFPEIMNPAIAGENTGFDISIANPPYGANIDNVVDSLKDMYSDVIHNYAEIYKIFFKVGLNVVKPFGIQSVITPNTFLSQPRYKDLRKFLLKFEIRKIVNLGESVFEEVVVPVCLSFIKRYAPAATFKFADVSEKNKFTGNLNLINSHFSDVPIAQVQSFKDLSLYFVKQLGKNQVYFDEALEIKDAGIQYHRSGIGLKNKGGNDLYERLFNDDPHKLRNKKAVWYGKLINKYYISPQTDEFFNLDYEDCLKDNESVSFTKSAFAASPKIIWRQTAPSLQATIDEQCRWFRNTIQCAYIKSEYLSQLDIKYVLGIVNSTYLAYLYNKLVKESGRVFPQVKITHVKKLPLIIAPKNNQKQITDLVSKVLNAKNTNPQADTSALEKQIDEMVYALYGLTPEEIAVVKGKG
ncbi:MAG: N-6 DNA methylase [Deltaproteobacteria bacterium]|nr:N-6 DNA methylase [Deltaproteobacteria bacterium]